MVEADNIVLIRDGKILETGTYKHLNSSNGEFAHLISKASNSNQSDSENEPYNDDTTVANRSDDPVQNKLTRRRTSVASSGPPKKRPDVEAATSRAKPQKEPPRQGGVTWSIYGGYAKASNLPALAVYVAVLLCAQTTELGKLQISLQARRFWISGSILVSYIAHVNTTIVDTY